jgi:site-specific DNA-methyltransferase (adenine-specific)
VEPTWTSDCGRVRLFLGNCLDVLPQLKGVNAIITDPPYSGRTHEGHDASANGHLGDGKDDADRRTLGYMPWSWVDVQEFVKVASPLCSGWMVCMTDHGLAPSWQEKMEEAGRYVFAPLPYYAPGSRVRLSGDGPSSWTIWIVVGRTTQQSRWGTLPGGYVKAPDYGNHEYMGGKPVGLMRDLVRDYSREGDVVCDPCMGGGTTGVACVQRYREFIGIEQNPDAFELSKSRIQEALGMEVTRNGVTQKRMFGQEINGV